MSTPAIIWTIVVSCIFFGGPYLVSLWDRIVIWTLTKILDYHRKMIADINRNGA